MRYFLGIDVGSSKTHAMLACEAGRCTGFGKAPGGNHQVVGYDGLQRALSESFEQALAMSAIQPRQIAGAGFGVAGYDFPSDREAHLQAIAVLGLACPLEVVNDGVPGLLAGSTQGVGVNVTAGSGVNCRGRGRDGRQGRIVGNGSHFGEYGGASEIVQRGLHLVNYAWIQRIPPTALTQIYLRAAGAKDELDLMEGLSNWSYRLDPSLALEIFKAAAAGDAAALELARWAGEELGWLAVAVARQIGMQDDQVEIIQSGSIFEAGEIVAAPMRAVILQHCPQAKISRLDGPPVVGAILLGMEQTGFEGYAVREILIESAKRFVEGK
jgi:N-acetylglucosamine kinase-like BadF-type ATPase